MLLEHYSKSAYKSSAHPLYVLRQKKFKENLSEFCKTLYGIDLNLGDLPLIVNTSDHLGILQYPPFVVSSFLTHLYDSSRFPVISFPVSIVPHNNRTQRLGFRFFEGKVNLFTFSERHRVAYAESKRKFDFKFNLNNFSDNQSKFLQDFQETIFKEAETGPIQSYKEQICYINNRLWPYFFEDSMRSEIPPLYQFPMESLIKRLLGNILEEDNFIKAMLFDRAFRKEILAAFEGVPAAWSSGRGSHFFWGIKDGRLFPLILLGEKLVNPDAAISVYLTEDSIREAIASYKIVPTMMLSFSILAFYYGIQCVGGVRQYGYLDQIKNIWIRLLGERFTRELLALNYAGDKNQTLLAAFSWPYYFRHNNTQRIPFGIEVLATGGVPKEAIAHLLEEDVDYLIKRELKLMAIDKQDIPLYCDKCIFKKIGPDNFIEFK